MNQPPSAGSPGGNPLQPGKLPGKWAGLGNIAVMCQGNLFFQVQTAGVKDRTLQLDTQAPLIQGLAQLLNSGLAQSNMLGGQGFGPLIAPPSLRPEGLQRDDPFASPLGMPAPLAWDAEQHAREFAALDSIVQNLEQQLGGPIYRLSDEQQRILNVGDLLVQKGTLALWRFRQHALSLFAEQASLYALAELQPNPTLHTFQTAARNNPNILRAWVLYRKYQALQPTWIDASIYDSLTLGYWNETLGGWMVQKRLTPEQVQTEQHFLNAIGTPYDRQATQQAAIQAEWYFSESLRHQPDQSVALVNLAALCSESAMLSYIETGVADRARLQRARDLFQQARALLDQRADPDGRIALAQCLLYEAVSLPPDAHLGSIQWAETQAEQMRAALGQNAPTGLDFSLARRNLARRDPRFIDRQKIEQARDILIGAGAAAALLSLAEGWLSANAHMLRFVGEAVKAAPQLSPAQPAHPGGNPPGPVHPAQPQPPVHPMQPPPPAAHPVNGNPPGPASPTPPADGPVPRLADRAGGTTLKRAFLATTRGKVIVGILVVLVIAAGAASAIIFAHNRLPSPHPTPTLTRTATPTVTPTAAPQIGAITEFSVPTVRSGLFGIVAGPDGNLWFTESTAGGRKTSDKIGRITPEGVITEYVIPTARSAPEGIARGPDGNLWFTEATGNKIGRITPGGVITEFPLSKSASEPVAIALGPDGNLWFTEALVGQIGYIFPNTPQPTSFVQLNANSAPLGITTGPDHSLWFTESGADKIGQLTSNYSLNEFPLPATGSGLGLITAGPDGTLWFTETASNQIGTITLQGHITEFPLPTPNSQPFGIAAGSDGALWFTETASDKIGSITPQGKITEFALPAGAHPQEITLGPDGNMWFTEFGGNKIGRIITGKSGATLQ